MSQSCIITGKRVTTGQLVSHSNVKVKRKLFPNLQTKRLVNPADRKTVTVTISTRGLLTLKKCDREGKKYDLKTLKAEQKLA